MKKIVSLLFFLLPLIPIAAWEGMAMPRLHVDGRYFKDPHGNIVLLHGFAQTYSPWFNEKGTKWTNYNVSGCLSYNKAIIDSILSKGWKMNFVRMHMDPYWSNTPGKSVTGESDISAFSMDRFKRYLKQVFIPMAQYAISKGLYVVMRPPGVCPDTICIGDAYQKYLLKVWGYVSQQSALANNPNVMFELANEPVKMINADSTSAGDKEMTAYMQAIVDTIRTHCDNIVLVPGLGYQSKYSGFVSYPVEGGNVGYAVHCYPGWYNGAHDQSTEVVIDYDKFKAGWDAEVGAVAAVAPVVVTEMDWAPVKYDSSWGKSTTGIEGGTGFGANFKKLCDDTGNVSWLLFTDANLLADFEDVAPVDSNYTFLTDPEACPWPCYHWFKAYANDHYPRPDFSCQASADLGDGTYSNPIIQGDFPDPDVVRVGDTYYMVSTTMHHFPGCTLLKSKDLINWEYCANPLTKISNNAEYNLEDTLNIYSKGSWANSLMYKNGKFYLLFNCFGKGDDAGAYLLSASDPEGTWTMKHLPRSYYDPGMFTDEDGTTYIVCGNTNLSVVQVDDDFNEVKEDTVGGGFSGLEGSHFFKKDGYYYIYSVCSAWPATQWCFRSKNVFGPYEKKEVFDADDIHQGAMIQTQTGEWWTMLMRDCGAFGRMPYLEPVTWSDNWPVIGVNGKDCGVYTKPSVGSNGEVKYLPTNDNFREYQLADQWQWNHNPDNSKWSLIERPGYLRLYTAGTATSLRQARNSLTQRILGIRSTTVPSYGTIKLDISHLQDGDKAGIAVFQDPYAYISVTKSGTDLYIEQGGSAQTTQTQKLSAATDSIYLRAVADINTSKANFYYSLDNASYTQFGSTLSMKYDLSVFVGNRFYVFNYATKAEGGYVDVDWFSTEPVFDENTYYDDTMPTYSKEALTVVSLVADKSSYTVLPNSSTSFTLTATFEDGHTEDVTTDAKYTVSGSGISVKNGRMIATDEGDFSIDVVYTDPLGNTFTLNLPVTVTLFPLTDDGFNPSIYSTGTFDESTGTLRTGQYGFGGWKYANGVDLSGAKYLVVQLKAQQSCGASFRLFDENSYWSTPAMYDLGTNTKLVIDLQSMVKNGTTTKCDPSHIYIVGFWTYGSGDVKIKDVFLSNDGQTSTGLPLVTENADSKVNVYTLQGQLIKYQIPLEIAKQALPKGIYIINGRKLILH